MEDYSNLYNTGRLYKGINCRVVRTPWSLNPNYTIMPEKSIDDIGNGCGIGKDLSPMEFEVETEYIPLRKFEV